ncbi:MAG: family 43 glycosylhydrolase [Bacteroidales bacterium]|nr:MAG: family 43 glycosylhydrolase [Bacteroidales bacterium]
MKRISILITSTLILFSCCSSPEEINKRIRTICNPVDISYRFRPEEPSRREAADPSIVYFKDAYYLFASMSGGYWHSNDLTEWTFIETNEIPTEEYAPTAISLEDTIYFLASSGIKSTIYKSTEPKTGRWNIAKDSLFSPVWDPAFFQDDDGRLYLYWGCSNMNPIYGIELDYNNNFTPIDEPVSLIFANPDDYGWEVPGDYNTIYSNPPWIEGAWMNKFNGIYYLQYAGPGTEFKSYSDGVYISENPLGPYKLADHNPFAYKPEGFAAGAGHGSTFTDKYGNYWHIGTITISVKHIFERRLGLYPTFFDDEGVLFTSTKYGDYPVIIPDKKIESSKDIFPEWMLLSYNKEVTVSSFIDSLPPVNITDENIRTYWAANTGNDTEWAGIDLNGEYDVYAIQINFAEHNTNIYGRQDGLCYQYTVEVSKDNRKWEMLIDKSDNQTDNSHDYTHLGQKASCRYIRIKNRKVPGGNFALSGFRVFGKGTGNKPETVNQLDITRNPDNRRSVLLKWDKSENATGYNISYGIDKNKLYHNYFVYSDTSLTINSLNTKQEYYFTIESFNENGITASTILKKAE